MKFLALVITLTIALAGCTTEGLTPNDTQPEEAPKPVNNESGMAANLPYYPSFRDCEFASHRTVFLSGTMNDVNIPQGTHSSDPQTAGQTESLVLFIWDCKALEIANQTIHNDVIFAISAVQIYVDDPSLEASDRDAYFATIAASTNHKKFSEDFANNFPFQLHEISLTVSPQGNAHAMIGSDYGDIILDIADLDGSSIRPDVESDIRIFQEVDTSWIFVDLNFTRDTQANPSISQSKIPENHPAFSGQPGVLGTVVGPAEVAIGTGSFTN